MGRAGGHARAPAAGWGGLVGALRAVAAQMAAGAAAAMLLAGLDVAVGLGPHPLQVRPLAALLILWAEIGAGWGLLQFAILAATARRRRRWRARGGAGARDVTRVWMVLAAVLVAAPLMGGLVLALMRVLGGVHNEALAASMAAVGLAGATAGLVVLAALVGPRVRGAVQRLADAGRLRAPGPAVYLACGALAALAVEVGLRVRFRDELSGAESLLLALALVLTTAWLGTLRGVAARIDGRAGWGARGLAVGAGLLLWLSALVPMGGVARAGAGTRLGRFGLTWLRRVTDVDQDGYSSLLGQGDCAPLDPAVYPTARDIPDNGVDEDCDGRDATARSDGGGPPRVVPLYAPQVPVAGDGAALNVIWIVVDAMRADSMSVYGYDKPTTPYLQALAKEAVVFNHAWSQASATMLSIPSMLSGRLPGEMAWVRRDGRLSPADSEVMLAERLSDLGYRTGLIVHSYFFKHFKGMFQGYDDVENVWLDGKMKPWFERSSPIATTLAIRFIERDLAGAISGKRPFFLTVYYEDPHHTYASHDEGYPDFRRPSKVVQGILPKHRRAKARYDGEIAFADRHVGFLLEYLRATPKLWARTVVVVVADHGEEFGEHGGSKHGRTCFRESTHVPLILRVPGVKPQRPQTVRRQHTVTGDYDRNRVGTAGLPDGLSTCAKLACQIAVGPGFSVGNGA